MATEMRPTRIDPTHPGVHCPIHGDRAPAAYLRPERYGCWHCHPEEEVTVTNRPAPSAVSDEPYDTSDIPEWMLGR